MFPSPCYFVTICHRSSDKNHIFFTIQLYSSLPPSLLLLVSFSFLCSTFKLYRIVPTHASFVLCGCRDWLRKSTAPYSLSFFLFEFFFPSSSSLNNKSTRGSFLHNTCARIGQLCQDDFCSGVCLLSYSLSLSLVYPFYCDWIWMWLLLTRREGERERERERERVYAQWPAVVLGESFAWSVICHGHQSSASLV